MHKHDDITPHATSFPSRILCPAEKDPGPGWAGCVLAFVLGADSILGTLWLLGSLQDDSYLCTCPLFPRKVGGFSSHLYPSPAHAGLVPSRIKINTASEGGLRVEFQGSTRRKTMIIWGLRCWDTPKSYTCWKLCTLWLLGHPPCLTIFEDADHTLFFGGHWLGLVH